MTTIVKHGFALDVCQFFIALIVQIVANLKKKHVNLRIKKTVCKMPVFLRVLPQMPTIEFLENINSSEF